MLLICRNSINCHMLTLCLAILLNSLIRWRSSEFPGGSASWGSGVITAEAHVWSLALELPHAPGVAKLKKKKKKKEFYRNPIRFSTYAIKLSTNIDSFNSFFPISTLFISFLCVCVSNLSKTYESRHLCLVLRLGEKWFNSSPLTKILAVSFCRSFNQIKKVPFS